MQRLEALPTIDTSSHVLVNVEDDVTRKNGLPYCINEIR